MYSLKMTRRGSKHVEVVVVMFYLLNCIITLCVLLAVSYVIINQFTDMINVKFGNIYIDAGA
jgi:hypothetical protein